MSDTPLYTVSRSYLYGRDLGYAITPTGYSLSVYPARLPTQLVRIYDFVNGGLPCLA